MESAWWVGSTIQITSSPHSALFLCNDYIYSIVWLYCHLLTHPLIWGIGVLVPNCVAVNILLVHILHTLLPACIETTFGRWQSDADSKATQRALFCFFFQVHKKLKSCLSYLTSCVTLGKISLHLQTKLSSSESFCVFNFLPFFPFLLLYYIIYLFTFLCFFCFVWERG